MEVVDKTRVAELHAALCVFIQIFECLLTRLDVRRWGDRPERSHGLARQPCSSSIAGARSRRSSDWPAKTQSKRRAAAWTAVARRAGA